MPENAENSDGGTDNQDEIRRVNDEFIRTLSDHRSSRQTHDNDAEAVTAEWRVMIAQAITERLADPSTTIHSVPFFFCSSAQLRYTITSNSSSH